MRTATRSSPSRLRRWRKEPEMSNDVAIIGVGLHPLGRFDKTAMQMGAEAIQFALTDAGVGWKDIQFGFGGSHEVSNPDAWLLLMESIQFSFTNGFNACALTL